jgi:GTPase KRas protein
MLRLWIRQDRVRIPYFILVLVSKPMILEEFLTLRDQWLREGDGFILVYSISDRCSFDRINTIRQDLLRVKGRKPPLFILVGNKCDQAHERKVSKLEGEKLGKLLS